MISQCLRVYPNLLELKGLQQLVVNILSCQKLALFHESGGVIMVLIKYTTLRILFFPGSRVNALNYMSRKEKFKTQREPEYRKSYINKYLNVEMKNILDELTTPTVILLNCK